ncbi:MAG: exosortase/archaeosortase family protein [Acidimicrobiales bacterium]
MGSQRVRVWVRVLFVVSATPVAFFVLQGVARARELAVDVAAMRLVGVHRVPEVVGTAALVVPVHASGFFVEMSPSCSSLASILTLGCLAAVLPRRLVAPRSRLLAFCFAAVAIFVGNLLRIDLSIGAGVLFGRSSLVLFHDWAGSIFGFAYTIGGFALMLFVLLPSPRAARRAPSPAEAPSPSATSRTRAGATAGASA